MNEEKIRNIARDTIGQQIRENIDSALIFKYVSDLEQENKELKKRLDKAVKEIKKELEENYHLSYGVALAVINILDNYKFLEGDK